MSDTDDREHRSEMTSEQIEHIAVRAAELGEPVLEAACDGALQGHAVDRDTVRGFVDHDVDLQAWLARGFLLGYRRRMPLHAPVLVSHDLIPHAGHYAGGGGHDLARWIVRHPPQPTGVQLAAAGVPATAEYHCGYVDRNGVQHWVYVERRSMSPGACDRCGARLR